MACPIHDVIQQKTRQQFLAAGRRISSMDEMKFDRLSNRSCAAAKIGGARRDRTDDLLLAKQALSQLSYGPVSRSQTPQRASNAGRMVGLGRLERPTSPLSGVRSNHLSYRPEPDKRVRAYFYALELNASIPHESAGGPKERAPSGSRP